MRRNEEKTKTKEKIFSSEMHPYFCKKEIENILFVFRHPAFAMPEMS